MALIPTVPPIPIQAKIIDDRGILTPTWAQFFQQVFYRIGGPQALTNLQLASVTNPGLAALQATVATMQSTITTNQSQISALQSLSSTQTIEIDGLGQGRQV
jgi:hypothetical protein